MNMQNPRPVLPPSNWRSPVNRARLTNKKLFATNQIHIFVTRVNVWKSCLEKKTDHVLDFSVKLNKNTQDKNKDLINVGNRQICRKTHLSKIRVCLGKNITALAHPNETLWCKTIYAIGATFLRNMFFKKSRSQHENQLDNFALPWGEFAKFSGSKKLQGSRKKFGLGHKLIWLRGCVFLLDQAALKCSPYLKD